MGKTSQWAGFVTSVLTMFYYVTREGLRASGTDWPDWLFAVMRWLLFGAAISGFACLLSAVFASRRQPQQCGTEQKDTGWALSPAFISLVSQRVLGILWLVMFQFHYCRVGTSILEQIRGVGVLISDSSPPRVSCSAL